MMAFLQFLMHGGIVVIMIELFLELMVEASNLLIVVVVVTIAKQILILVKSMMARKLFTIVLILGFLSPGNVWVLPGMLLCFNIVVLVRLCRLSFFVRTLLIVMVFIRINSCSGEVFLTIIVSSFLIALSSFFFPMSAIVLSMAYAVLFILLALLFLLGDLFLVLLVLLHELALGFVLPLDRLLGLLLSIAHLVLLLLLRRLVWGVDVSPRLRVRQIKLIILAVRGVCHWPCELMVGVDGACALVQRISRLVIGVDSPGPFGMMAGAEMIFMDRGINCPCMLEMPVELLWGLTAKVMMWWSNTIHEIIVPAAATEIHTIASWLFTGREWCGFSFIFFVSGEDWEV